MDTSDPLKGKMNVYASLGIMFAMYLVMKHFQDKIRITRKSVTRSLTVLCITAMVCSLIANIAIGMVIFGVVCICIYSQIPRPLLDVGNKAVLITGCDSSIVGYSLACHLDRLGFKVFAGCICHDGDGEKQLKQFCSDRLVTLPLDVTSQDEIEQAVALIRDQLDKGVHLWGVVNTASIIQISEFELIPLKCIQQEFDINAMGQVGICKAFIPLLRYSRGRIVNVTFSGTFPMERTSAHTMSQYAIEGFSNVLRLELKKWGIHLSIVQPSFLGTDLVSKAGLQALQSQITQDISAEQRAIYGDEYLAHMMDATMAKPSPSVSSDDIIPLSEAVTEALLSVTPQSRYRCGAIHGLYSFCSAIIPQFITDMISTSMSPPIDVGIDVFSGNKKDK